MSFVRVLVLGLLLAVSVQMPADAARVVLAPPTDAAVLDPFRLPNGAYGAGNRGIEYDTVVGDPVRAAADGVVAFSGPVAGWLFVSVDHSGGLRTTYGFVGRLLVRRGAAVRRGDVVAVAAGPFHFTVRWRGGYVDPATLFGRARVRLRLIPPRADRNLPDTLLDGSIGPRTMPLRDRRNHRVRATPGRLGVPHEHTTGKEENHGSHLHEAAVGGRRPLRPPDPPLEPEDEAVHPRRAVRHPHRGSPPDAQSSRDVLRLRA